MLTEILIKPFIKDLEHQGIEDTTPYQHGFLAGMTALSSILSDNIDNKAQLFTYLGMAISEGMQGVESQVMEENNVAPIFEKEKDFGVKVTYPGGKEAAPNNDLDTSITYTTAEGEEEQWDWIPSHDDLPASLIQKYAKKDVFFTHDFLDREKAGKAILDLSSNRLQVIDTIGNQIKRPYYIKLR